MPYGDDLDAREFRGGELPDVWYRNCDCALKLSPSTPTQSSTDCFNIGTASPPQTESPQPNHPGVPEPASLLLASACYHREWPLASQPTVIDLPLFPPKSVMLLSSGWPVSAFHEYTRPTWPSATLTTP